MTDTMTDDTTRTHPASPAAGPADLPDDLEAVLADAWARLVRGAGDRRSAFHTMGVATVRADGAPTVRTVVLRGADPDRRILRFHTDRRSPKLAELEGDGRVCLLLYDPDAKIQLRIDGIARVQGEGDLVDRLWAATRPQSRECYRQPVPPGGRLGAPGLSIPDPVSDTHGRENFTVVEVEVGRIDWLFLTITGHRRALFDWSAGTAAACWIAP